MSSQEYDKGRTILHKKRKATLPKIASPAIMDVCEAEFLVDASPIEMEEGVNDRNDDNNEKYEEEKEAEFPDDTSLVEMEVGVGDRKDDNNEKYDEVKMAECPDDTPPADIE